MSKQKNKTKDPLHRAGIFLTTYSRNKKLKWAKALNFLFGNVVKNRARSENLWFYIFVLGAIVWKGRRGLFIIF